MLLWSGLSNRALWGPEGRSAVIVKEMLQSAHYFLPTINGAIYFDKPLLGYWVTLPFVRTGGLNEAMLRLPSTLAGLGTILVIFFIGQRLFGRRTAIVAALFLATSPMFLLWARTASPDMMNVFVVWVMLWAFLLAREGRARYLLMFYVVGAIGSFFKGPVAPAVAIFTVFLYSTCSIFVARNDRTPLGKLLSNEYFWIASAPAAWCIAASLMLFGAILITPIIVTGTWLSASMMWKENIIRFLGRHDHRNPPYTYIVPLLLYCAPWTFFTLASLWEARHWERGQARRLSLLAALGILLFFLLSCSRRPYYILPLIPALALITGKAIADWTREDRDAKFRLIDSAVLLTFALVIACGVTASYAYFFITLYRDASELFMTIFILSGAATMLHFFRKKERLRVIATFFAVTFLIDIWGFTSGMRLAERGRTLRDFACQAKAEIEKTGERSTVLFNEGTAELIFYLNTKSPVTNVCSIEDMENFSRKHPRGLVLANLDEVPQTMKGYLQGLYPIVVQRTGPYDHGERFVLMRFGEAAQVSNVLHAPAATALSLTPSWLHEGNAACAGEPPTAATGPSWVDVTD